MKNLKLMQDVSKVLKEDSANINCILEIGSRDADDSNFMKNAFNLKDDSIFLVEPNTVSQKVIQKNYPNFKLFHQAIHNYNGTCNFNNINNLNCIGVSSVKDRIDGYYNRLNVSKVTIECITGKKLLSFINKPIDYCQIDVEGLGYEVLEGFGEKIKELKYILIESEHKVYWEDQILYDKTEELLKKTHKLMYKDFNGTQSNTLWKRIN